MKYSKQEIQNSISETDLSSRHQKSLRELMGLRRHPISLGYLVYTIGIICFIPFVYYMRLGILMAIDHPEMKSEAIHKASSLFLFIAMFLISGAKTYINRIRASRAVSELLMKTKNSEQKNAV